MYDQFKLEGRMISAVLSFTSSYQCVWLGW